jgi:hypothetical protein
LDMGHTLRGKHITRGIGKGRKPKTWSVWCAHCRTANTVTLNWQRPLWNGDQKVVKRSGRGEPTWVVIHMYVETILRTSLYS